MGQTIAQKIVARAAGRSAVEVGEYVNVSPDYTCCQELAWQARKRMMQEIGVDRVARPDKVIMVVDHTTSAAMGSAYYLSHREMKDFAFRNGVENFFGAGSGLRHLVLTEKGFARPGLLVFSDEPNIASIGALGALNVSVSSEVVVTQITDENWMMVPRSARIALTGRLPFGVLLRDLAQVLIRDFAQGDQLTQCCIEFVGPAIPELSLDARQSLLACAYHTGADTALMPVDATALAYVRERAQGRPYHLFDSDPDAVYVLDTVLRPLRADAHGDGSARAARRRAGGRGRGLAHRSGGDRLVRRQPARRPARRRRAPARPPHRPRRHHVRHAGQPRGLCGRPRARACWKSSCRRARRCWRPAAPPAGVTKVCCATARFRSRPTR